MATSVKVVNSPLVQGSIVPARSPRALSLLLSQLQQRITDLERITSVQQLNVNAPAMPNPTLLNPATKQLVLHLTSSGALGALKTFSFVTTIAEASLTNSRKLAAGTDINLTDGGAGTTLTVNFRVKADIFANKPGSPTLGDLFVFTDSNTVVWGAIIAGLGANTVLGWWNGTNWTVVGK